MESITEARAERGVQNREKYYLIFVFGIAAVIIAGAVAYAIISKV